MTVADDTQGADQRLTEPVRFRPFFSVIAASVLAVLILIAFTIVGLLLRQSDTGAVFRTSDQVAMIILGVLLAAGTMLWAVPRVRADAEGVEVRNVLTSRRFAWREVLAISFPDGAAFARLELPDDEYYTVMAVQAVDGWRAVTAVRTLRALHKQAWQAEQE
ncbi:PH domain-containing protein [Haloechinothrix halophila]|uniref:PH domain-containing protein n=1 Tax=Haloechinothrix halophila TaxID=1069073 RepID=UPI001E3EED2E|nr:PH domain-containing protein [Haloechinothrix halophila]